MPVAAALAGGIYAERWLRLHEQEYLLWVSILLCAAAIALRLQRHAGALAFALLGTVLVGSFFLFHWRHARPPEDIANLVDAGRVDLSEPARLTGWIAQTALRRGRDETYLLRMEEVESLQRIWPASGTIRLQHFILDPFEPRLGLRYGERVSVLARLRPVRGFLNPGSFDRQGRARREGVLFYASIKASKLVERLSGPGGSRQGGSRWMAALDGLRRALLDRLDALFPMPSQANGLLRAVLFGDRSGLDRRVLENFRKSGAYHALVVSGLHTAAVAGFLLLLLRLFRLPPLPATLLALAGLACYVALVAKSVPTQRAAVMIGLYLLARLIYRERALLNTIAAAALLLLILHPADLNDAGFQLSFFAVLLIAAIALPWIEQTSAPYRRAVDDLENRDRELTLAPSQAQFRIELRMLHDALRERVPAWLFLPAVRGAFRLYELVVVSLVIQVGFLLPLSVYFYRASWIGVSANLFLVPLLGLVVPLGVATMLLALISETLAGLLAIPLAALVEMMLAAARWHAGLALASLRVPPPPLWLSVVFLLATALLASSLLARRARPAAAGALALAAAAVLITWHPFPPQLPQGEVEITTLDVAQGDALVVLAPPGRVMVVDVGGLPGGELATDTGEIVSNYLWSRGIRRIDVLALTHAHYDHVAGLETVMANFQVAELWLPSIPDLQAYQRLQQRARQRAIPVHTYSRGDTARLGEATVAFLSPGPNYQPARRPHNNDSLVMRLNYGRRAALLAGDVQQSTEMELLRDNGPVRADWLKVPHHGSKSSSSLEFLSEVDAPYGVISVAANSRFGHPHPEALERLRDARVRLFRTDRDGAVTWATDGNRVRLGTFQWERRRAATDLW